MTQSVTYNLKSGHTSAGDINMSDTTGDVTFSSASPPVSAIAAGVIVNADVNASAAIVGSKLDLSTITGDVTVSAPGVSAIAAGVIVNADVNASAAIAGSKLAANAQVRFARSPEIDIDNGAATTADYVVTRVSKAITLTAARVVYTDATSGTVAAATVQVGTTVTGVDLVAVTVLEDAKAVGTVTALSLASAAVAANTPVIVRHTGIAATAAGKYYVELEYTVND
jgi:hypothetical protein